MIFKILHFVIDGFIVGWILCWAWDRWGKKWRIRWGKKWRIRWGKK